MSSTRGKFRVDFQRMAALVVLALTSCSALSVLSATNPVRAEVSSTALRLVDGQIPGDLLNIANAAKSDDLDDAIEIVDVATLLPGFVGDGINELCVSTNGSVGLDSLDSSGTYCDFYDNALSTVRDDSELLLSGTLLAPFHTDQKSTWTKNLGSDDSRTLDQSLFPLGAATDAVSVSAASNHTCAVTSDGAAFCWGLGSQGRLGDGSTTNRSTPVQVKGVGGEGFLSDVVSVSAAFNHTCAATSDGAAFCWGYGLGGKLGNNSTLTKLIPTAVWSGGMPGNALTNLNSERGTLSWTSDWFEAGDCVRFFDTGTSLDNAGSFLMSSDVEGTVDIAVSEYGIGVAPQTGYGLYSDCVGVPSTISVATDQLINGRRSVIVTWYRMPTYNSDRDLGSANTYQVVIIERGDDAFDVEYNYGSLTGDQFENPNIPIGWVSKVTGKPNESHEWVDTIAAAQLVDNGSRELRASSLNSNVAGRYVIPFREGVALAGAWATPNTSGVATFAGGFLPGGPPTGVSATRSDTSAGVSWTAGTEGVADTTGYTVTATPGGATCTTTSTSCTISGLSSGSTYALEVVANTSAGPSDAGTYTLNPSVTQSPPVPNLPSPVVTPGEALPGVPVSLAGEDRVATSIAIAEADFATVSTRVAAQGSLRAQAGVITSSRSFADALTAGPLAVAKVAPLLLTAPDALDARLATTLTKLLPRGSTVYIVGGTNAVSDTVATSIANLGFTVERIAGIDRYDTAVNVARVLGNPTRVFAATGLDFPDALAAGVIAARESAAVLLTQGTSIPLVVAGYLLEHPDITIDTVGGPAAAAFPNATSHHGQDRYATATALATAFPPTSSLAGIASGQGFADGIAAAPYLARRDGVLLLTHASSVPTATSGYITTNRARVTALQIFGGLDTITDTARRALATHLR